MQLRKRLDAEVLSTPGHLVSLAARAFERLSELRLKPVGFGVGYLPVLVAIKQGKARSQTDLARYARVEQPSMAQMLSRMERDGLIERTPHPDDGRSSIVALTKTAQARLPEACAVLFKGNQEVTSDFTREEAAQLTRLLARLITNLDRVIDADESRRTQAKPLRAK